VNSCPARARHGSRAQRSPPARPPTVTPCHCRHGRCLWAVERSARFPGACFGGDAAAVPKRLRLVGRCGRRGRRPGGPARPRWRGYYARDLEVPMNAFAFLARTRGNVAPTDPDAPTALGAIDDTRTRSRRSDACGRLIGAGLDPNRRISACAGICRSRTLAVADRLGLDLSPAQVGSGCSLRGAAGPALNANRVMGALAASSRAAWRASCASRSRRHAGERETSGLRRWIWRRAYARPLARSGAGRCRGPRGRPADRAGRACGRTPFALGAALPFDDGRRAVRAKAPRRWS